MRGPSGTGIADRLGGEAVGGGATSGSGSSAAGAGGTGEGSFATVASGSTANLQTDKGQVGGTHGQSVKVLSH